jgi:tetratricopeptide (TPR) repeat protein
MDSLLQIIRNLKKEEIRNFKIYTNRFQRADEIKIATLFDHLRSGKFDEDEGGLVARLFPEDPQNMNAYYRLKNRLKTELEKSLLNLHHNLDERITVMNLITLASIFAYKSQNDLSLYYLKKAEKISAQNEFYDLLELIYNEMITMSNKSNEINPQVYIQKLEENTQKNLVVMQANQAIASVSYELSKANFNKAAEEIPQTLQRILDELHIANEIYNIPHVKFKIHFCVRDTLLQKKDFVRLEYYLKNTLVEFEAEGLFIKSTHAYKIRLVTWIVNALIINKKWNEAILYTEKLYEELQKYNRLFYDNSIWTYYQSLVTTYMSSNRLDEAIALLDQIKELPAHKGLIVFDYAIHVNLALCYYYKSNLSAAIKTLSYLLTKDIYSKLSTELQFSISMLEVILHYENNGLDFVSYRIGEMKRQFNALLKRPDFTDEKTLLKILLAMSNKPNPMKDTQILNQINNYLGSVGHLQVGSGRHIDYGLWLTAKLKKQHYYEALLETLQTPAS